MNEAIKPCPFCGAEAQIGGYAGKWACCTDPKCAVSGPSRYTAEQAIAAWNAAPRVATAAPPPPNTVKVRVAVSVGPDGHWIASGGSGWNPEDFTILTQHHEGDRLTWLTAHVPLPAPAAEIEAEIDNP